MRRKLLWTCASYETTVLTLCTRAVGIKPASFRLRWDSPNNKHRYFDKNC